MILFCLSYAFCAELKANQYIWNSSPKTKISSIERPDNLFIAMYKIGVTPKVKDRRLIRIYDDTL